MGLPGTQTWSPVRPAELHSAEPEGPDLDVRLPHRQPACVPITPAPPNWQLTNATVHLPSRRFGLSTYSLNRKILQTGNISSQN